MSSDTNLLHQPDTLEQQPSRSFKPLKLFTLSATVLFIALLVGTGGYLLGARSKQIVFPPQPGTIMMPSPPITTQQLPSSLIPDGFGKWQTYTDNNFRFELQYPNNWFVYSNVNNIYVHPAPFAIVVPFTHAPPQALTILIRPSEDEALWSPKWKHKTMDIAISGIAAKKYIGLEEDGYEERVQTYVTFIYQGNEYTIMFPNTDDKGNHNPI